jgi:hypothetical protein
MRTAAEPITYDELVEIVREAEFCVGRLPAKAIPGITRDLDERRSRLYDRLAEVTELLPGGRKIEDV